MKNRHQGELSAWAWAARAGAGISGAASASTLSAAARVGGGRLGVGGEVLAGGRGDVAGRLREAAVVAAQDRDAAAAEVVGEDQEGPVAQEPLVAVLRARAGDQRGGRERTLAVRQ